MIPRLQLATALVVVLVVAANATEKVRSPPELGLPDFLEADGRLVASEDRYPVLAQVLTRHGDRTPITRLDNDTVVWDECDLKLSYSPFEDYGSHSKAGQYRTWEKAYIEGREQLEGDCPFGELTPTGREQHKALGSSFRRRFVELLKMVEPELENDQVYVRSSDVQRTQHSAMAFMTGMFPADRWERKHRKPAPLHIIEPQIDNIMPRDDLCPAIPFLKNSLYSSNVWQKREQEYNQPMRKRLAELIGTVPDTDHLYDVFWTRMAHDKGFPAGVTWDDFDAAIAQGEWDMKTTWEYFPLRRLGMGPFLGEWMENMRKAMDGELPYKFMLNSGHDYSVGPFSATLGIWRGWPPYASYIASELWYEVAEDAYYVVWHYHGELVTIPGCDDVYCPFSRLSDVLTPVIPVDYWNECGAPEPRDRALSATFQGTHGSSPTHSDPHPYYTDEDGTVLRDRSRPTVTFT